jgi:riboflavin synthase
MVYTGIIQGIGEARLDNRNHHLSVRGPPGWYRNSRPGDSIAVNGVCLTLENEPEADGTGTFFVMEESRKRTNICAEVPGLSDAWTRVNLEHALRSGDSVGGHFVSGHVSGVAPIVAAKERKDGSRDVWVDLAAFGEELRRLVVHKVGSMSTFVIFLLSC